jgi:hypothetical protein
VRPSLEHAHNVAAVSAAGVLLASLPATNIHPQLLQCFSLSARSKA